jgi:hypothetical protein
MMRPPQKRLPAPAVTPLPGRLPFWSKIRFGAAKVPQVDEMLTHAALVWSAFGVVRPLGVPSRLSGVCAPRAAAAPPLMQLMGDDAEEAGRPGDEDAGVADFRAQLMRQMMGKSGSGVSSTDSGLSDRERLMRSVETASLADSPASGIILVADPARFCSRNPFARPVKDLGRFGLDGPVAPDEMPADLAAQMLPVVLLLDHGPKGSFGVLLERRTGTPGENSKPHVARSVGWLA